jgi:hypothetical protein
MFVKLAAAVFFLELLPNTDNDHYLLGVQTCRTWACKRFTCACCHPLLYIRICFIPTQYLVKVIRIWLQKLKLRKYFKELIFNTLLFADDQLITADTEDNLQRAVYLLSSISKQCNFEISTSKTKVFGCIEADHLRAKIIINDETLYQVNQLTYLGCSISYTFSNDVEIILAKFLQLIGTI